MKLKTAPGLFSGKYKKLSVCESCGETFGCGARLDECWCNDVIISEESAADLKAKFGDCLCPKCLAKIADRADRS